MTTYQINVEVPNREGKVQCRDFFVDANTPEEAMRYCQEMLNVKWATRVEFKRTARQLRMKQFETTYA